nr:MAG TPA: DNA binding protein [Microviridae sp.]
MILHIYSIFDNKARAYLPPFFMVNDQVAYRAFADAVADPSHQFSKNPNDYCLYCIGSFDDSTGGILSAEVHENLGLAAQFSRD